MGIFGDVLMMIVSVIGYIIVNSVIIAQNQDDWDTTGVVILNLFPSGVLQLADVINNGYWHARSPAYFDQPLVVALEWARLPADTIFIVAGALPLAIAAVATYVHARRRWGRVRAA